MIDKQHPITPCPELVLQWLEDSPEDGEFAIADHIATQAARWGSDQELKACCEWLDNTDVDDSQEAAKHLRAARRPKSPSLKEQAFNALDTYIYGNPDHNDKEQTYNSIRRALEQLDD